RARSRRDPWPAPRHPLGRARRDHDRVRNDGLHLLRAGRSEGDGLMEYIYGHYNYWVVVFLMMLGFYVVISRANMVKVLVGLTIFQTSVFIFYISLGKIRGGTAPILMEGENV